MQSNFSNSPALVQACKDLIRGSVIEPRPAYYDLAFSKIHDLVKSIVKKELNNDNLLQYEEMEDWVQMVLIRLSKIVFRDPNPENPVAIVRSNIKIILSRLIVDVLRNNHKMIVYVPGIQSEEENESTMQHDVLFADQTTPEQEAIGRESRRKLQDDLDAYMKSKVSEKGYRLFCREMEDSKTGQKTPVSVLMEMLQISLANLYQLRSRNKNALKEFFKDLQ